MIRKRKMKYLKSFKLFEDKYWGNLAGGAVIFSKNTKRFLIGFRSDSVNEPNTWGMFGGKVDEEYGETSIQSAIEREIEEETGLNSEILLLKGHIFRSKKYNFVYHNYIAVVEDEFTPILNWENDNYKWLTLDELYNIEPKHPGLKTFLLKSKDLFERQGR